MSSLEALKQQIASIQDLQAVVKTMKTMAAASIRQYERAVESLADYNRTIEMGLQALLGERSPDSWPAEGPSQCLGAIVFGSERGLCGQFNEQIAAHAIAQWHQWAMPGAGLRLIALGSRVIEPLTAAGLEIAAALPMPITIAGITPTVQELLLCLEDWRSQEQIERVVLFGHRPRSRMVSVPCMVNLLPIDRQWLDGLREKRWDTRIQPTFTMEWDQLFAALLRQYLFVSLYRALAESLASENSSRLLSMQVAEQNIEERLAASKGSWQQLRQTIITEEILEILSGFEVLTQTKSPQ